MHIKYSPCKHDRDTTIEAADANSVKIDGQLYEFDPISVQWLQVAADTEGIIIEAHREAGELYVTVRRFYSGNCADWDTGSYHEVTP